MVADDTRERKFNDGKRRVIDSGRNWNIPDTSRPEIDLLMGADRFIWNATGRVESIR